MIEDLICAVIIVITIIIVGFSIGYFIWFTISWSRLQRKREEMIMRIQQRQWEILMRSLSKKNKEDA